MVVLRWMAIYSSCLLGSSPIPMGLTKFARLLSAACWCPCWRLICRLPSAGDERLPMSTWGDLLDFRTMLEPAAAAHVAEHATAPQRERIAAVAERGIAPDGTGYHEFHELLVQASENPLLTTVLAAIEQAVRWAAAEQDISQYDRDEAAKSHRAIAAAITAKDPRQGAAPNGTASQSCVATRRSLGIAWGADDSTVTVAGREQRSALALRRFYFLPRQPRSNGSRHARGAISGWTALGPHESRS